MILDAYLQFLTESLKKCRVQVLRLSKESFSDPRLDFGLRKQLGLSEEYDSFFAKYLSAAQPKTLYKLADSFLYCYLFLLLPSSDDILFIGPYLSNEIPQQELLDHAERIGLPPANFRHLEMHYSGIPVLGNDSAVFAMLDTFGEAVCGGNVSVVDINREQAGDRSPLSSESAFTDVPLDMEALEKRYAHENEMMRAVSQGLTSKAELLFSGFSQAAFEQRLSDPVRNLKNYAIIMNTLLRKAAENGGVHPLYIDRASTEFAGRIESLSSAGQVRDLMTDMFRSYCRLVKNHAIKKYSPPVQKTITLIDSDLAADLRLSTLAAAQGLSTGYLSALFHRETGETVTAHVNRKRMNLALHLLSTTHLQVQSVAQLCGIPDVNYFSKLFKKQFGRSPKTYRENQK